MEDIKKKEEEEGTEGESEKNEEEEAKELDASSEKWSLETPPVCVIAGGGRTLGK